MMTLRHDEALAFAAAGRQHVPLIQPLLRVRIGRSYGRRNDNMRSAGGQTT